MRNTPTQGTLGTASPVRWICLLYRGWAAYKVSLNKQGGFHFRSFKYL